jgi:Bacterial Ig domain
VSGVQPVSVTAGDNVGVANGAIMIDGTIVASFSGKAATYNWNTSQSKAGGHKLQSKVQDTAGNVGMSAPVAVTVATPSADTTPPNVTSTSPKSASTLASGAQTVTSTASDDVGVTLVKTAVNGTVICQQTSPPYSCPVSLSGPLATIDVTAFDAAGNTRMAEVNVYVTSGGSGSGGSGSGGQDTTPPKVTITYPPSGVRLTRGAKTFITARTSDNSRVAVVKTYVNGSLVCQQNSSTSFCPWIVWNVATAKIQVKAFDSTGNAGVSSVSVFPR